MSIHLYPISTESVPGNGYAVRINGISVSTDCARVSAIPYNRRWPGHQRTLDQTETAQFLSFSTDEPVDVELTLPEPSDRVVIRPRSLGITPEVTAAGTVRFTLPHAAYCTVEPYGRHNAFHIFADPPETVLPSADDPDVLRFGPGIHDVGQIELHSGQTLYLEEGAVVYACITAVDAENIRILGRGILDNSRNREILLYETTVEQNDSAVNNAVRQHTVQLEYCTNVLIDGITIRDSLVYNIRPLGCRGLTVRNVKIIGCWRFNSDGIDMHNCEDVLIEDCFLRTFDDAICVKGFDCYYEGDVDKAVQEAMYRNGEAYDVFRNVLVRRCVIWNDWGKALEIGAETRAEEISGIVFEDCDIIHTLGPVLDCCNVDYADVHHVMWRRIRVEMDEVIPPPRIQEFEAAAYGEETPGYYPPVICGTVEFHHEYSAGGERRGKNRDLLFEDIEIFGDFTPAVSFHGYSEEFGCRDIAIRRISLNGKPVGSADELAWHIGNHCENIRYEG